MDKNQKEKWQITLEKLENEMGYTIRNMKTYKKLRELVNFHEIISHLNPMLDWMVDTYTTDSTMSIRRLVDSHPDRHCHSLYKFLVALKDTSSTIINQDELQQDIDELCGKKNRALGKILRFTNQDRAHSDDRSGPTQSSPTDPSFDNDIFPEIEKIKNLVAKYFKLINGKEPQFLEAKFEDDLEARIDKIDLYFKKIYEEKLNNQFSTSP